MCTERDNKKCHRYIVCQRLLDDYGINRMHIGYIGTTENHANQRERKDIGKQGDPERIRENTLQLLTDAKRKGELKLATENILATNEQKPPNK